MSRLAAFLFLNVCEAHWSSAVDLINPALQEAAAVAERLRQRIQGREVFLHNNVTLRVSASLGVSASEERGEYQFEALQSVADGRLYLAKQNGRNQVCFRSAA